MPLLDGGEVLFLVSIDVESTTDQRPAENVLTQPDALSANWLTGKEAGSEGVALHVAHSMYPWLLWLEEQQVG